MKLSMRNEEAEIEWMVSFPWKGPGEGCRDETQLRKPEREENTRQIIITSLGKGDSETGIGGENFLIRFSPQVMGRIWTNREGRRHLYLGTSVNKSK